MRGLEYIVVTPARNEARFIQHTIDSMVAQSMRPAAWIIVNDGSTDETGNILEAAAMAHPWIRVLHRPDRGCRKQGGGVMEAFYAGFDVVSSETWDFLVKLDADLSFGIEYFEQCFQHFEADPRLGIGGGVVCIKSTAGLKVESKGDPRFHVRGATKIYRRRCWEAISPLLRAPGWDSVDELKANMLGWKTTTFAELRIVQHKQTGSADGWWKNWVKNGVANYVTGYHPLFMVCKCVVRLPRKPVLVGSAGLLCGYCSGYCKRSSRVTDADLVGYVRRQQVNRLLHRKSIWQ